MVGSPPENCTTSGLPSVRTKSSSMASTSSSVRLKPGTSFGEAKRASHVAGAVDLDDAETSMLLMVRTEAAIMRAPFFDLRSVRERDRARLVELAEGGIGFRVPIDQSFEGSTVGTALGHEHFVISEQDFGVDYFLAVGADTAGEFVEDIIGIFLSQHRSRLDSGSKLRNCSSSVCSRG